MLICNRVVLKKAGAVTACPAVITVVQHHFAAAFTKDLTAALVWPACEQSERK